ncbi:MULTISPECIES: phosphate ABC transporter substrate-binding protein PstS [Corynebacterium]|nr:phosphate ABC transporter substrate-binding protein PstS [Corynebacterium parakroppenstedtii]MBY0797347.1 phosphate ABC transporter substrate-binding protein PstS [Corynebacterium parakroppenstedtii]PMC66561.1 phosphate ABC transporter substrate-binding protein PstS [Corynebacterium kroppenstedtii]
MNRKQVGRCTALATIAAVSALTMVGCNSDDNSADGGSSSSNGDSNLSGTTGQLTAEGSSAQQKAMSVFSAKYSQAVPGAQFSYNSTGSGAGQKQFVAGQVNFGGSDSPLDDSQMTEAKDKTCKSDVWQLPMVIGPVAVAYKLDGADSVALSPEVIAKIFKGEIKKWNDDAIKKLNDGVNLPDKDIKVIYRSDESGTSDNFQKFLKASAPGQWDSEGKAFPSTTGSGANGSSGVVQEVGATDGAITYVEAGFAKEANLKEAAIDFGQGPVELNKETVGNALDKLTYKGEGNNMVVDTDALFGLKEKDSYPLFLTTYELVCSKYQDSSTGDRVRDFLTVAINDGQDSNLEDQGYIPVTGQLKDKLTSAIKEIK